MIDIDLHVKEGGIHCPFCYTDQIEGGDFNVEPGYVTQDMACLECEAEWRDVYRLESALTIRKGKPTIKKGGNTRFTIVAIESGGKGSEDEVQALIKEHDYVKVNLPENYESFGAGNGEGVWAVPCSREDAVKCRDDSSYEEVAFVRLCNQPICHPLSWGDKIAVQTRRGNRPVALPNWGSGGIDEDV